MKQEDATPITGFLIREFERFTAYLDDCGVDPLEASSIIGDLATKFHCPVNDVCDCYEARRDTETSKVTDKHDIQIGGRSEDIREIA